MFKSILNNTAHFPIEFNLQEYKRIGCHRRNSSQQPLPLDFSKKEETEKITELRIPKPKQKMKGFQNKNDTDPLITTGRKKHRKVPVQKRTVITSNFLERVEQQNNEKQINKETHREENEEIKQSDIDQTEVFSDSQEGKKWMKQVIRDSEPDYIKNKGKIIEELKNSTLTEGDFKYLKEGFVSDSEYKILFSFIALAQILEKDTELVMRNKYQTQKLLDIIFQVMTNEPSIEEPFHGVGFFCFLKLSYIVYILALKDPNIDTDIFIIHLRDRIIHILDITDLKLCEEYYDHITAFILEDLDFPKFISKLNLWDLIVKQYSLFMTSFSMQKKLSMLIIECGFKQLKSTPIKQIDQILKVVMAIFVQTEEKETQSYCLWSLSIYCSYCQDQKQLQMLIDTINEKRPISINKIVDCLNPEDDFGEYMEPSSKIIQKLIDEENQMSQTFVEFFLNHQLLNKISELFKTHQLNKIKIALNLFESLIHEETLKQVLGSNEVFKEINVLFRSEITNSVDMQLTFEFLRIYKTICQLSGDLQLIGQLEIIDALCFKLNQLFSNQEFDYLFQEIIDLILYIFDEFEKEEVVKIFMQNKNYLALEKLQYLESHKMYKKIYWMLKKYFPQYQGDLFNISENDSIYL